MFWVRASEVEAVVCVGVCVCSVCLCLSLGPVSNQEPMPYRLS